MSEYHKIETLYNRDVDGSKKLIEGSWRNPTIEALKNIEWEWTEKIDGTNIRIYWDGHSFSIKGRTDKALIPGGVNEWFIKKFINDEAEELFEQMFGDKQVVLYGEGYGAKIQNGGLYRQDQSFIMFDVMIDGIFLEQTSAREIAKALDIDFVATCGCGTLEEAVEFVKEKPLSAIGTAPLEGVVCRCVPELRDRRGNRLIVKVKVKDFE